ncbi:alpha/beta hydrolase [Usitatibacter palustris]|uniref:Carboxylesterase 2 n=1 Tax=Usitatibacter palustris TaxID=2732487 RepID=A0A6M4H526_9PROT|nr:alpha/beta hydrolase [Usitatibacter palustris]QJR14706.1 Carboxylesterase 2 [Usitatibacter palustris]
MEMLQHIELVTGPDPKGTIIWMHGLGADGWDFVPIVRELPLPEDLALRFIFPHAPPRAVTINNNQVMRAWYDIVPDGQSLDFARKPDEAGIRESQKAVEVLIEREKKRGVPADKIILAGFSQGGAIALQTGLRHAEGLAGIAALSTYLAIPDALAKEASAANRRTPIFMVHGTQDPVIPVALADASRKTLEAAGYPVQWTTYPMPHSVCAEEVEALGEWIAAKFRSRILLA